MKKFKKIFILSLLIFVFSFSIFAESDNQLTIIFTHDLHDNLESIKTGENTYQGGFARIATAINQEKARNENNLVLDAGDFSMGTLYQVIFSSHAPALRLMGAMGFDATTLGNHEFDFRPEGLAEALNSAVESGDPLPELIISNLVFPENSTTKLDNLKNAFENYNTKEYFITERNGEKIGIIGLMGEDADSNAPMSEVEFLDNIEKSKELVKILKEEENVDLIIALSHSGIEGKSGKTEDEILAKEVPEIDLIISGHSHDTLDKPIIVKDTIIVASGNYGENLGVVDISKEEGKWKVDNYKLIEINEEIEEDPIILEKIEDFKSNIDSEYLNYFGHNYGDIIAHSSFSFTSLNKIGAIQEEEPLGHLIGDAYKYAVELAEGNDYIPVDVAIVASGVIRGSLSEGNIKVEDVFNTVSLGIGPDKIPGYPLIDVYLTGKELKSAAEVDASIQPLMSAAQLYLSGLQYKFNPHRIPLNKVTEIFLKTEDGLEELDNEKLYRVVANLYSGQMLDVINSLSKGIISVEPKDKNGNIITDYEDRIIYQGEKELKEWYALNQYLESFPKKDGTPEIPQYYSEKQGNKIVEADKSLIAKFTNLNRIGLFVIITPLILIVIIIGLIKIILSKRKRKKLNKK